MKKINEKFECPCGGKYTLSIIKQDILEQRCIKIILRIKI